MGFDYCCTSLSISPLKDAQKINAIGQSVGEQYGVAWLPSDFKKQERYKRSIALSREYGLYRQNFCGCVYSKQEKEKPVRPIPWQTVSARKAWSRWWASSTCWAPARLCGS